MFFNHPVEVRVRVTAVSALLSASVLVCSSAIACSPTEYRDDRDRMRAALATASRATVAIDGYVVEGHAPPYVGTVAVLRPTRIWFGPQQPEYRVLMASICHAQFDKGERVRILLNEVTPHTVWERLRRKLLLWRGRTYEVDQFAGFKWAMRYRLMRQAVERRAREGAEQ